MKNNTLFITYFDPPWPLVGIAELHPAECGPPRSSKGQLEPGDEPIPEEPTVVNKSVLGNWIEGRKTGDLLQPHGKGHPFIQGEPIFHGLAYTRLDEQQIWGNKLFRRTIFFIRKTVGRKKENEYKEKKKNYMIALSFQHGHLIDYDGYSIKKLPVKEARESFQF
jgi:hypothetical protein